MPPSPRPWSRTALLAALVTLAVGSFLAGVVLQVLLSAVPSDVVVPDQAPAGEAPDR